MSKVRLAAIILLGILFVSGCTNTWQGMKKDSSDIWSAMKRADDRFREKYW